MMDFQFVENFVDLFYFWVVVVIELIGIMGFGVGVYFVGVDQYYVVQWGQVFVVMMVEVLCVLFDDDQGEVVVYVWCEVLFYIVCVQQFDVVQFGGVLEMCVFFVCFVWYCCFFVCLFGWVVQYIVGVMELVLVGEVGFQCCFDLWLFVVGDVVDEGVVQLFVGQLLVVVQYVFVLCVEFVDGVLGVQVVCCCVELYVDYVQVVEGMFEYQVFDYVVQVVVVLGLVELGLVDFVGW